MGRDINEMLDLGAECRSWVVGTSVDSFSYSLYFRMHLTFSIVKTSNTVIKNK